MQILHTISLFFADLFPAFGAHNLRITHHTATQPTVIDLALTTRVVEVYERYRQQHKNSNNCSEMILSGV